VQVVTFFFLVLRASTLKTFFVVGEMIVGCREWKWCRRGGVRWIQFLQCESGQFVDGSLFCFYCQRIPFFCLFVFLYVKLKLELCGKIGGV
jgi:hypothetical protein